MMVSVAEVFAAIAPKTAVTCCPAKIVGVTPVTDVLAVTFEPMFCRQGIDHGDVLGTLRAVLGDRAPYTSSVLPT